MYAWKLELEGVQLDLQVCQMHCNLYSVMLLGMIAAAAVDQLPSKQAHVSHMT